MDGLSDQENQDMSSIDGQIKSVALDLCDKISFNKYPLG